jgi:hypothetical protein
LYKDNIHRNSKREIWPYELDILTTINVAFEVDGLFWHSSDKNPLRKHLLCESKNIKLYRIFDTLWNIKQDIMKSIFTRKILEEPCDQILVVKPITYNNTIDFIKNYSLTPYKKSCLKLGLFLKETLVAILTGRHKNDYLYITNICPATNIFFDWLTPLLKTLCDKNLYIEIDRRLFYGSSLIKNNFKIIGYTKPKTLKYDSSAHDIPSNVGSKTILDCGSIILERRVK